VWQTPSKARVARLLGYRNAGTRLQEDQTMNSQNNLSETIKLPIYIVGLILVFSGAASLVYLAISVIQVLQSPQESELVQWIVSTIGNNELILSGYSNEDKFELRASEAFQYLFFGVIGLMMLNILTSVVNSLISGGIQLIKFSNQDNGEQPSGNQSNPVR
jgi:hypothetical protein